MSLKYHIWTIGCQMNEADSRHLASQLEAIGYTPTLISDNADLVVMNTCVVRQQAEDKATGKLNALHHLKKKKANMTIALMGCMVGIKEAPRLKEQFPFVDVFMPPSETEPLMDYLGEQGLYDHDKLRDHREKAIRDAVQDEAYRLPALQRGKAITAHVPIVLGCSHACTFCIIPYRRGAERSRPREEVAREITTLIEQSVREVMLLGQIVDRYGVDLTDEYDLADLLREVAAIDGLLRVRFLTSHPNWMTNKLIDTVAEIDKLCPQFEVPVQAGNDEVLADMKRGYTSAEFRSVVERIRTRIPDAAIHTDIIVGFPGETEDQFMDTYHLLNDLRLDKLHLAKYSERPKTIASRKMPDTVSPEEKEQRRLILDELDNAILTEKNSRLLNQSIEVLVEGRDERRDRWRGRTPQSKLVYFQDNRDLFGQLVDVRITWTGPYSLIGEPVGTVQILGG